MSGTQQAFAEMDERVEALRRELEAVRRERDAANDVLRELASYLGAGGYNATDPISPAEFDAKIRWGIRESERAAIAAAVARIKGTVAYRVMRPDFCRQIIEAAQQRPTAQ